MFTQFRICMAKGGRESFKHIQKYYLRRILLFSTPPASKSPAPIMDLGAQDQQKNPKSEGLQWDLRILELDLRFRGGLVRSL